MNRSENEYVFNYKGKVFYVRCVRYRENTLVNVNVINKMIANTYNFKNIILILCTENEISNNASDKIDKLTRSIYITSCFNLIKKIKSFV
jgi:hypothetical protein